MKQCKFLFKTRKKKNSKKSNYIQIEQYQLKTQIKSFRTTLLNFSYYSFIKKKNFIQKKKKKKKL